MSKDSFGERGRALEESFFAKRNWELLEKLRQKRATEVQVEELAASCGISDHDVLRGLLQIGLDMQSLAALSLVPLIEVAWADEKMEVKERQAILDAAQNDGVATGSECYKLLESWLEDKPGPDLLNAWKEYTSALLTNLSPDSRRDLKQQILGRARRVAEAAGGLLGMGKKISTQEQQMLDELSSAFD